MRGFRVLWTFARVELLLRRTPLPETCRRLGLTLSAPSGRDGLLSGERAQRLARDQHLVAGVSERWPAGDTCLRRCLVLGHLSRDLDPHLALGVRGTAGGAGEGGSGPTSFEAHSWLEVAGHSLDPASPDWQPLRVP